MEEVLNGLGYCNANELKVIQQRVKELLTLKAEQKRLIQLLYPTKKIVKIFK